MVQIRSKEVILLHMLILVLNELSTATGLLPSFPGKTHMKPLASQSENSAHISNERAIVVGGGPVGLSAALILANRGYDVSLFEATSAKEIKIFNPALAYLYNINERGQVFTKMFPNIHKMLVERSVASDDTGYIVAPADIKKELQTPKRVPTMGAKSYWIPRHTLTTLLWDAVDEHNESRDDNSRIGRIDYEQGVNCVSIHPSNELENHISVVVLNKNNGEEKIFDGKLVVGADGIKSKVRECLQEQTGLFESWHYRKNKFKIRKWVTPATGLKLKVLQLPARYSVKDSNGENIPTKNTDIVALRGIKDGPLDRLTLSSLPVRDSDTIRAGNCIARPSHVLFTMTTGAEVKVWFKDNYPRLDLDALISDDEWERFAKAKGLAFPPCQYSPGLQVSSDNNECGVLLIGDAAHAFSPDIGQGINSGFMDVIQFNEILSKTSSNEKSKVSLGAALKEYEHIQAPEVSDRTFTVSNQMYCSILRTNILFLLSPTDKSSDPSC